MLVPGTALVLAPTTREGFSWSAAAFQGSLEVQAYAATALRDNSIATAVLIVAIGYGIQWMLEDGALITAKYLLSFLGNGALRLPGRALRHARAAPAWGLR